jgi:hypothetical protein
LAGENIEQSGNIVTANELYESGAVVVLAVNENAATEPYEVDRHIFVDRVTVVYRLEVGAARAVGARIRRDHLDAFRTVPIRRGPIEGIVSNGAIVLDCVDLTVDIVGRQDLTPQGPEAHRHYSRSFNVCGMLCVRRVRDELDNSSPVNLPDGAVLARYDHLELKCALMVERKRTVVRAGAPDRRKQREDTSRELIDVRALCDENVARSEPGRHGLNWSNSQVFFHAGTNWTRYRHQQRDIPIAVDQIEILVAECGCEHFSRDSGHAYGPLDNAKDNWVGGVQNSCER